MFQEIISEHVDLKIPLKNETDIDDAAGQFTRLIQRAAWESMPTITQNYETATLPEEIRRKIAVKRRIRRQWQLSRNNNDKRKLNKVTRELKKLISQYNNSSFEKYVTNPTNTAATDYSLWKATKRLNTSQNYDPPIKKNKR